jgi:hypothetical protein
VFKKFLNLFSKKKISEKPKVEEQTEEIILPDSIEVPWSEAGTIKNLEGTLDKIHTDFEKLLYTSKMKELKAIKLIEKVEEIIEEKTREIKDKHGIPDPSLYELKLPEATGRPGFLKKKETS